MADLQRMHRNSDSVFDLFVNEVAKTADYTILPGDNGTLFTNRGAVGAVVFTLPALGPLLVFWFRVYADQNFTIQSAAGGDMVVGGSLTASSVAFTTSGQKVGNWVKVYTNLAADKWYVEQSDAAAIGLSGAELAFLDGVTAGTGAVSKALVLDANGKVTIPSGGEIVLARAALAAAGTGQADAAALTQQVQVVTGADDAKGVALPAAATTIGPYLVINDAAKKLLVYPVNGGNDAINALTAGTGVFTLEGGEWAIFVPTSATQWYTATRGAMTKPTPMTRATVANAGTISAAQLKGRVLYQDASGGNVTMTTRTGTQIAGDLPEMRVGDAVQIFVASNHATNTSTIAGGTDVTLVGSGAVVNTGGTFLLIKTAATTFDLVRVG